MGCVALRESVNTAKSQLEIAYQEWKESGKPARNSSLTKTQLRFFVEQDKALTAKQREETISKIGKPNSNG